MTILNILCERCDHTFPFDLGTGRDFGPSSTTAESQVYTDRRYRYIGAEVLRAYTSHALFQCNQGSAPLVGAGVGAEPGAVSSPGAGRKRSGPAPGDSNSP